MLKSASLGIEVDLDKEIENMTEVTWIVSKDFYDYLQTIGSFYWKEELSVIGNTEQSIGISKLIFNSQKIKLELKKGETIVI